MTAPSFKVFLAEVLKGLNTSRTMQFLLQIVRFASV